MTTPFETRLFINNEFKEAKSDKQIPVQNPYDHSMVCSSVHSAGSSDVDDAVAAAAQAYTSWKKTSPARKAHLMNKLADLLDSNATSLGKLETVAMGAPAWIAEHGVHALAQWLRYYAGWTDKLAGETHPDCGDGFYRLVSYEPLGVCAGIAAWNATFLFVAWKVAPAIAAGNTFVFKASEKSPLGILALGKLVVEAGFPPGVINLINGTGEAGAALASHPRVAKISFTGSTATGRKVQIAAAQSNLKKCTLELGGKSAALVFADADMDGALETLSRGFLVNSTQVCAALSRVLVHSSIKESFVGKLRGRFQALAATMGDPSAPGTFMGPVADGEQFRRITNFIDQAREEGLEVVVDGSQRGGEGRGYFVAPTLVVDPPDSSSIYCDEVFGPVLCVRSFESEEEGIALANDSEYALGASVFTSDVGRALRVSGELTAGSVGINCPIIPDVRVPFGGFKRSGYGRESGRAGIMGYVDSKTVVVKL